MSALDRKKAVLASKPGRLRIIAGQLKGSRLDVPDRPGLRPTPDRIRETLFNWLMPWIEGARCLDLFAGTGALGIEAASRLAAEVVMVERDPQLVTAIKNNLLRLRTEATVICADAESWLLSPARSFDIVFVDPPFSAGLWQKTAEMLETGGWLMAKSFVYMESPRSVQFNVPETWQLYRETSAGLVRSALYRRSLGVQ